MLLALIIAQFLLWRDTDLDTASCSFIHLSVQGCFWLLNVTAVLFVAQRRCHFVILLESESEWLFSVGTVPNMMINFLYSDSIYSSTL